MFRSPRWYLIAVTSAALLFVAATYFTYRSGGFTWYTLVAAGMCVVGALGIVETIVAKVELTDDAMLVTKLWSKRSYPRDRILSVHSAKGTPTKVQVEEGRFIELPAVDASPNSIRAWIKVRD